MACRGWIHGERPVLVVSLPPPSACRPVGARAGGGGGGWDQAIRNPRQPRSRNLRGRWERAALPCRRTVAGVFCVCLALAAGACGDREEASSSADVRQTSAKSEDILSFPDELRVGDESANEFLTRAMKVCAAGRYEPFRLLWSVKEEPLARGEFEQGWQAVLAIRIRAFQQALIAAGQGGETPTGETVFLVLADVDLDPSQRAGERRPHREVVLMLVREGGEWRLAQAPDAMRKWIKEQVQTPSPEPRPGEGRPAPATGSDDSQ